MPKSPKTEATAPQDVKAEAASPAKKLPIKTLRVNDISVSIFSHEREAGGVKRVNFSSALQRSYKDRAGEWQHTPWFDPDEEAASVVSCVQQAHEYVQSLKQAAAEPRA